MAAGLTKSLKRIGRTRRNKAIGFSQQPSTTERPMQVSKLFVGNLKMSATNEKLFELFSNYGEVKNVNVIASKGFAFVEMGSPAEAQVAKDSLNDTSFDGVIIRVDEAKPQKKKSEPDQKRRWKRF